MVVGHFQCFSIFHGFENIYVTKQVAIGIFFNEAYKIFRGNSYKIFRGNYILSS
jgi:hypothetical protein